MYSKPKKRCLPENIEKYFLKKKEKGNKTDKLRKHTQINKRTDIASILVIVSHANNLK